LVVGLVVVLVSGEDGDEGFGEDGVLLSEVDLLDGEVDAEF
jgi:hypothetical protein